MQLLLPACLDVYIPCSCDVRTVLCGWPARPWDERESRKKKKKRVRARKNES
jgi:hypothetical protein